MYPNTFDTCEGVAKLSETIYRLVIQFMHRQQYMHERVRFFVQQFFFLLLIREKNTAGLQRKNSASYFKLENFKVKSQINFRKPIFVPGKYKTE